MRALPSAAERQMVRVDCRAASGWQRVRPCARASDVYVHIGALALIKRIFVLFYRTSPEL